MLWEGILKPSLKKRRQAQFLIVMSLTGLSSALTLTPPPPPHSVSARRTAASFIRLPTLDFMLFEEDVLEHRQVRSRVDCLSACLQTPPCVMVTYLVNRPTHHPPPTLPGPPRHDCRLYSKVQSDSSNNNMPVVGVPTENYAMAEQTPSSCCEGYSLVCGCCFKIVTVPCTHRAALEHCRQTGGRLLSVETFQQLEQLGCEVDLLWETYYPSWLDVGAWSRGAMIDPPPEKAAPGPKACFVADCATNSITREQCGRKLPYVCKKGCL